MSFTCRRCGKCCRDLVFKDNGILRGLTLLPEETRYFPDEHVKPYFGVGKRPYNSSFKVLAFQLTTTNCPNLKDNQCNNYKNRPGSCRQYPFSLDQDKEGEILLGIDMNCPAAVELVSGSDGTLEFSDRDAAMKLFELKTMGAENPRKAWFYDLESEKWVRYDKMG